MVIKKYCWNCDKTTKMLTGIRTQSKNPGADLCLDCFDLSYGHDCSNRLTIKISMFIKDLCENNL